MSEQPMTQHGQPIPPVPADVAPQPTQPTQPTVVAPPGGTLVTLPSGYRVAVRGASTLRGRDRQRVFAGVDFQGEDKASLGFQMLANILRIIITAWDVRDFDDVTLQPVGDVLPIPSATADDVLGLLSLPDASALDKAAEAVQKIISPSFEPTTDPASPTSPSVD